MGRQSHSRYSSEYKFTVQCWVSLPVYKSLGKSFSGEGFQQQIHKPVNKERRTTIRAVRPVCAKWKAYFSLFRRNYRKKNYFFILKYKWVHEGNAHKIKLLILAYRKGCFLSSAVRAWMCPQHHEQAHTASAGASYFRSSHNFFRAEKKEV